MNDRVDDERGATLASMASVLADATRATFLVALLDGRAWTATELARHAGVAPSTATAHLHRLRNSGLITEVRQGRHRYVRLADPATADLVESLVSAAPDVAEPVRSLSASTRRRALAFARTCYDHLAGTLGVAVTDAMTARGFLTWENGLAVTDDGAHWLTTLDPQGWPPGRGRAPVRPCLDWTERRSHLAGAAGALVCRYAIDAGWVARRPRTRAVTLTATGRHALREHLGLAETVLRPKASA